MSDSTILAIIGALGSAFGLFMSYKMAQLSKLATKTHELSNSLSLILAKKLALATEQLAEATGKSEHIIEAQDALKALTQAQAVQDLAAKTEKKA